MTGCKKETVTATKLPTLNVERGDINVRVQATGTVEPINPVDVKSKAGGAIINLPVEVGSVVKKGQVLTEVDPRDVKNKFDQAVADDVVSIAALNQMISDQARKDSLYKRHVITSSEHDSAGSAIASARADLVSGRANVDLARQSLEDATVEAPFAGTIVSRPVSNGTIITSATAASGGTTLMTLADLQLVRMRVNVDEVEMGNVKVGESATVAVDAFPDHKFTGTISKVEPQAVLTQGVTFFQVLVTIDNREGLLMPGMNGEVTIQAADLKNVTQIPIDAIRATNELAPVSRMFNIPVDSLISSLRRDLVSGEGEAGVPGRYVIVALPNGTYEMRLIKIGPSDLRVAQVVDGVKEGEKVVQLGAIMMTKPPVPPTLQIAANMKRGAPITPTANSATTPASGPPPVPQASNKTSSNRATPTAPVTQAAKP
ncbi:MAG TPA: efflux RND transporter periplasmic adaptor subunit, partial [Gemmatimonadaceae bacterium]